MRKQHTDFLLILILLFVANAACASRYLDLKPCSPESSPVTAQFLDAWCEDTEHGSPNCFAELEITNNSEDVFSGCLGFPWTQRLAGAWGEDGLDAIIDHVPCVRGFLTVEPKESHRFRVYFHAPENAHGPTDLELEFRLYKGTRPNRTQYLCQLSCVGHDPEIQKRSGDG